MDYTQLKPTRKALGLTLQAAADCIEATREAVRLAEAGSAPNAAKALAKLYHQIINKKSRAVVDGEIKIELTIFRRGKQTVLRSESSVPFEVNNALIDAVLDCIKGDAVASTVEI